MALAGPPVDGAFTRGGIRPRWSDLGWALGQPLRRYAAWAAELGAAGAIAAAGMTPFGQASGNAAGGEAQRLEVTAEAAVWLAAVCLLVALLRIHDPLRQSGGWGEAMARARRLARAHPLIVAVSVPVLLVGTLDEAGAATPSVVQQLLQLVPLLAGVNLAGFAAGLLGGWTDPLSRPALTRALAGGLPAPVSFALCAPPLAGLSSHGMPVPSMLAAAAVVAGLGGAVALLGHRNPGFRQPRPWLLAMAAGMVAGGVSGGAVDLVLAGALIGAVAGTGMEVALRVARSAAVLWDRRRQLPLAPGEVVYRLDGREMEITLEAAGPAGSEGPTRHSEYREMTGDGWRVTQLSGSCWEGTKGRAQLLGRRRADLLEVIEVLHPEAPGGSRVVASPPGLEAVRVGVAGGSRAMQQPTRLG